MNHSASSYSDQLFPFPLLGVILIVTEWRLVVTAWGKDVCGAAGGQQWGGGRLFYPTQAPL